MARQPWKAKGRPGVLCVRPPPPRRPGSPIRPPVTTKESPAETPPEERPLRYVDHIADHGLAMFAGALALQQEGIIAKDPTSPYIEGPEKHGTGKNQESRLQKE